MSEKETARNYYGQHKIIQWHPHGTSPFTDFIWNIHIAKTYYQG